MNRGQSFHFLAIAGAMLLLLAGGASAATVQSGSVVMDSRDITAGPSTPVPTSSLVELLANAGFEAGSLPPWTSAGGWSVVGTNPHSGSYCAFDVGNNWVRQDFPPINTANITSVTFWARQPEAQIQAYDFFYSDNTFDEDIWFVQTIWTQKDITSFLRPAGNLLTGIRIWGYVGGPPDPDETYLDDVSIQGAGATPVEPSTWGGVKALFPN
jgi:hypothetical protein